MYLHQYFSISAGYIKRIYKEWKFINSFLVPLVNDACIKTGYQLNKEEKKKVLKYYPLLTICANADNYASLLNRSLSHSERQKITLMCAMATLCDDLLDEEGWLMDDLFIFLESLQFQRPLHRLSQKAMLILSLNESFLKLGIPERYWLQLKQAFIAQANSIKQNQPNLSIEETFFITKEKNGQTSLLVASLMDENWTDAQLKVIYQTGVTGQLMNDLFDTYKDLKDGIYTMISKVKTIAELKDIYKGEVTTLHRLIRQLNQPLAVKNNIILRLTPINAFGMVALHRMAEIEQASSSPISWKDLPRKKLIFDMAFWSNRFLYLKYMHIISKW